MKVHLVLSSDWRKMRKEILECVEFIEMHRKFQMAIDWIDTQYHKTLPVKCKTEKV